MVCTGYDPQMISLLEWRGQNAIIKLLWTLVRWSRPSSRQGGQCIEHNAAAAMHQEGNGREQSPLGNNTALGSLGLKESNLLGVRIV